MWALRYGGCERNLVTPGEVWQFFLSLAPCDGVLMLLLALFHYPPGARIEGKDLGNSTSSAHKWAQPTLLCSDDSPSKFPQNPVPKASPRGRPDSMCFEETFHKPLPVNFIIGIHRSAVAVVGGGGFKISLNFWLFPLERKKRKFTFMEGQLWATCTVQLSTLAVYNLTLMEPHSLMKGWGVMENFN